MQYLLHFNYCDEDDLLFQLLTLLASAIFGSIRHFITDASKYKPVCLQEDNKRNLEFVVFLEYFFTLTHELLSYVSVHVLRPVALQRQIYNDTGMT